MDYSIRELECFLAVAEELSFTRAAKRLHLAQPPLSRHIHTLEDKIGTPLFLREPRRVSLTPAGSLFYEETRNVPQILSRAGDAAKRCALGQTSRLRLGFVSAVMNDVLVDVFRRFRQSHPNVQVILEDIPPNEQLKWISEGKLDGGFVGLLPHTPPPGVRFVDWYKEPLMIFMPVGHPLSARRSLPLKSLAQESFIAVSHESAPTFATHVRDLCKSAGFRPQVILESPRAQAVALMVAAGSGVAILPESLTRWMNDSVVAVPILGSSKITHVFACQNGKLSSALESLSRMLSKKECCLQKKATLEEA